MSLLHINNNNNIPGFLIVLEWLEKSEEIQKVPIQAEIHVD